MNAYELAKLLEVDSWYKLVSRQEIVDMLRQQADQIEQLKKEFDAMVMSFETRLATRGYEIQIKDQADRIAELEKPVKQLSDEEIAEIIRKHWNREYGNRNMMALCKAIIKEITE